MFHGKQTQNLLFPVGIVVTRYSFSLLPNIFEQLFYGLIGHVHVFFGEMSVTIIYLLFIK